MPDHRFDRMVLLGRRAIHLVLIVVFSMTMPCAGPTVGFLVLRGMITNPTCIVGAELSDPQNDATQASLHLSTCANSRSANFVAPTIRVVGSSQAQVGHPDQLIKISARLAKASLASGIRTMNILVDNP